MNERDIFLNALEYSETQQRLAFVKDACGDNHQLHAAVQKLLTMHDQNGEFLEQPAAPGSQYSEQYRDIPTAGSDDATDSEDAAAAAFTRYLKDSSRPGWLPMSLACTESGNGRNSAVVQHHMPGVAIRVMLV